MWKEYSGMQCRRGAVSFSVNRHDVASLTIPTDLLRRIGVPVPGRAQLLIGEGEDAGRLKVEPVPTGKGGLALTRQGQSDGRWTMQFKAHLLPFPTQPHRATEVPAVVG